MINSENHFKRIDASFSYDMVAGFVKRVTKFSLEEEMKSIPEIVGGLIHVTGPETFRFR